jgi:hypothetical protein
MEKKADTDVRIADGYAHLAKCLTVYVKGLDESKRPTLLEWLIVMNTMTTELLRDAHAAQEAGQ